MGKRRFDSIDGMRGIAAIIVVCCHLHPVLERLFLHGHLAVDFFFMLSGFVLMHVYGQRFDAGMGLSRYISARLTRLYPMLLVGGLLGAIVVSLGLGEFKPLDSRDMTLAVVGQILLIPALCSSIKIFALNPPQWSILFELVANALHRLAHRWLDVPRLCLIVGISAIMVAYDALTIGSLDFGWARGQILMGSTRAVFGFFLGILIYRLDLHKRPAAGRRSLLLPTLLLLIVSTVPIGAGDDTSVYIALWELFGLFILLPWALSTTITAQAGKKAHHLGAASYPLYALHAPFAFAMQEAHLTLMSQIGLLGLLVVLAWLVGKWVEEPFMAWRAERMRRRAQGKAMLHLA